jgi:L-ribulose-5-phosphate 4-epimerase
MLENLKQQVCDANLKLVAEGLVIQTWGNVSGVDRESGHLVIKPSGVPYAEMKPEHMVVLDLASGEIVEGDLRPSSDTPTHLILARAFEHIGGIVHTHSMFGTAWAQAQRDIPALGTTHADYFYGAVPCTRMMTPEEIRDEYEANTGHVIVERFAELDSSQFPGVLVASHAPFSWGKTPDKAVENAVVLENVARLASETLRINPSIGAMQSELLDKHFLRKHGPGAYYGQKK